MKASKRKISRKPAKKELKHTSEFSIKPRTFFIAGIVILLLVVLFAFSQVKTNQTAFVVNPTTPEKVQSTPEDSIGNLQEINTEFGKVCKYELFKNGEWTKGHISSISCSELANNKALQ